MKTPLFLFTLILSFTFSFLNLSADEGDGNPTYTPNVLPASPTASELGRYGQVPVGLFTGTPNISIPIYTYKAKNISVPISLSYNSNGVKVDQVSSWVGLGWSLNAGGVVTRTVRGGADDEHNRNIRENITAKTPDMLDYLELIANNPMIDTEPDMFSFNFNGYSGKFVLGEEFAPLSVPYQNLRIETDFDENPDEIIMTITIITPDGVKYIFGEEMDYCETSRSQSQGTNCAHAAYTPLITSWYLNRIEHPTGETVNFTYQSSHYHYYAGTSQTIRKALPHYTSTNCPDCGTETRTDCDNYMNVKSLQLTQISSPGFGKITFSADTISDAIEQLELESIVVTNRYNQQVKELGFDYTYFLARKFLTGLRLNDTLGITHEKYAFEYNDPTALPERNSFSQDHWGFYNGARNGQYFVPNPGLIFNDVFEGIGGNREPSSKFSDKGVLTKIYYPTGGYNTLDWEPNTVNKDVMVLPPLLTSYVATNGYEDYFPLQSDTNALVIQFDQQANISASVFYDSTLYVYNQHKNFGKVKVYDATVGKSIIDMKINVGDQYMQKVDLEEGHTYWFWVEARGEGLNIGSTVSYYQGQPTIENQNVATGGVRIKRVTAFDKVSQSEEITRYYYYDIDEPTKSSGVLNVQPRYFEKQNVNLRCSYPAGVRVECEYVMLHSSSLNNLYSMGSNHMVYEYVTVSHGENFENGAEEHSFRVNPDSPANWIRGNQISGTSYTNTGWDNGLKNYSRFLKKDSNGQWITLKKEEFTYTEDPRIDNVLKGNVIRQNYELPASGPDSIYCTQELIDTYLQISCSEDHKHHWMVTRRHPLHHLEALPDSHVPWCLTGNFLDTTLWHSCHAIPDPGWLQFTKSLENYDLMQYDVLAKWNYPDSKTLTVYDENGQNLIVTNNHYYYDNVFHGNLSRTTTFNSLGDTLKSVTYYLQDYSEGQENFDTLFNRHIISVPIDQRTYTNSIMTSGKLNKYNDIGQPIEIIIADEELGGDVPFDPDSVYTYGRKVIDISYDQNHNIATHQRKGDIPVSYIWGYGESLPIAQATNAKSTELGYTGFEHGEVNNWDNTTNPVIVEDTNAHSGDYVLVVDLDDGSMYGVGQDFDIANLSPESGYKASVWVKGPTTAGLVMIMDNNPVAFPEKSMYAEASITGWQLLEVEYSKAEMDQYFSQVTGFIRVYVKNNSSTAAYFDDIRFHPSDAMMKTLTYDPLIGATSEINATDLTSYYRYDNYGRLNVVMNDDRDILGENSYNYGKYLYVSPDTLEWVMYQGDTLEVNLVTNLPDDVTIQESESWLSVSPSSGQISSFEIIVQANSLTTPRTGDITISAGGLTTTCVVIQKASPYVSLSPSTIARDNAGGVDSVLVSSNVGWSVHEDVPWLDIIPPNYGADNGSFKMIISENNDIETELSTYVKVSAGGIKDSVYVTLAPADYIHAFPSYIEMISSYQNEDVTVNANTNWTVSEDDPDDFFDCSATSGVPGTTILTISGNGNTSTDTLSGYIQVSGAGINRIVRIQKVPH